MQRKIAAIGDTHCGSYFGLMPAPEWGVEVAPAEGQSYIIKANPGQLKLLEYWHDFWTGPAKDCDTVFEMGDSCEGQNRKEFGRHLTVTDINAQLDMAEAARKPYYDGRKIVGVCGSGYHQTLQASLDQLLIKRLGGKWGHEMVNCDIIGTDVIANLTHSSGGAIIYKMTAADRESIFQDAAESLKLDYHVGLHIRGHWHWYGHMENESRHVVYTPCWKLLFLIAKKSSGMWAKHIPSIGGVVITIEGKDIQVEKHCYPYVSMVDKPVEV